MENIIIKTYYYIIKVTGGLNHTRKTFYKIGEAKNENRPNNLVEKYTKLRAVNAEILAFDELPNNSVRRLNDKTIHKNISKLTKADPIYVAYMLDEEDGKEEFFENTANFTDAELVEYIKNTVAELAKDEKNFKAKVATINNVTLDYSKQQNHKVDSYLINQIRTVASLNLNREEDKNILLVGQFEPDWVATFAMENKVFIWHDTVEEKHIYNYSNLNDKIVYLNDIGELLAMSKKFDYIISNPPYAIGNEITKAIVDNVDFDTFVNLMPVSKYKAKELYKNVSSIQSAEDTFDDAAVGDSLTVAILKKDASVYSNYQELEFMKMDPRYVEFYKLNAKLTHYALDKAALYSNAPEKAVIDRTKNIRASFAITSRTVQNGTHQKDKGAFDIDWNIHHSKTFEDIHIAPQGGCTVGIIYFDTENEQRNLCRFWYDNPLMNNLLKGLNKSSGTCRLAIPNIDWSKERDYEHLTLDDIMRILREENPDVA